jgi:hypothetical protein
MNSSIRILFVDDAPGILADTVRLFENTDHAVEQVAAGEVALKARP